MNTPLFRPLLALCLVAFIAGRLDAAPKFQALGPPQKLFEKGTDGYFIYKIPCMVTTRDGKHTLAIAEGRIGSAADQATTNILMRRSSDNGVTWSKPQLIHADGGKTVGNPCVVLDGENGAIWLFFCVQNHGVWATSSNDNGGTWSTPANLSPTLRDERHSKFYATGPGRGIQLTKGKYKGRLLIPAYASIKADDRFPGGSKSFAIYSDDHGKTWTAGKTTEAETAGGPDGNECMITELNDGRLYMAIRNNMNTQGRGYALSEDGGESWSVVHIDRRLPEPVNQVSIIPYPLKSGKFMQIYVSPSGIAKGRKDKSARRDLTLWISEDDCATWKKTSMVQRGPSAYSDMAIFGDGTLGVFYEAGSTRFDDALYIRRYKITE
jgi:sialidase-1